MPELSVDIAVANRFISSLSKSLQALCHGCMEFDTGIEIIGYININIDSGSKVDYVLNEKVLKSTNNSMTFVSNSFLAKKEQQRHTRDESCSPIPPASISLPTSSLYQPRQRGSNYGSPFHRTSQFSPHSQVLHGSQKRQWGSDWRTSKKHRPSSTSSETASFSGHPSYLPSSQIFSDTNFRQSSAPSVADNKTEDDSEVINIKKEAVDTESEIQDQGAEQDQNNEDEKSDSSSKMKIKCDPDAVQPADNETDKDDTSSVKGSTDFKGTFLDPSQDASDEQNEYIGSEKQSETISKLSQSVSDEHNIAGPSGEGAEESDEFVHRGENTGADLSLDYDQGNEDYSQSVHSDAGEASSDNGQFEVIEIDDEDEDVQAMFGDSRFTYTQRQGISTLQRSVSSGLSQSIGNTKMHLSLDTAGSSKQWCPHCQETFSDTWALKNHLTSVHKDIKTYLCKFCDRVYQTAMGLHYHIQRHTGKNYLCTVCKKTFTRDSTLKLHLRKIHMCGRCPTCKVIFKIGQEYSQHVLSCTHNPSV